MLSKEAFIRCPHCGAHYLPNEIFIENGLLGNAHNIVKTSKGEIVSYQGKPYDLQEKYVCDYCNKEFLIEGTLSFKTTVVEDFEEEYVKTIYENRIELEEN